MQQLRDYQSAGLESVTDGWRLPAKDGETISKQLGIAATGAGKTIMFAHAIKAEVERGNRCLILAHRDELITQAAEKLHGATGIHAAVEAGMRSANPTNNFVIIAGIKTMVRRLDKYRPDAFDFIICDEGHHSLSPEWQTVLKHFDGHARVLAVTATPDRGDKKSLGRYYQRVAFNVGLLELIRRGYLVKVRAQKLDVKIDLSHLTVKAGREITDDQAADAIHPALAAIGKDIAEKIWDRKTLLFFPRRDISLKFAALLSALGIETKHIDGNSSDRKELLRWFATPGPKALTNAMLLTEGFDQPDVNCICCLRPIRSRALYSQIVGRGTRLSPGKTHLLVLDPLWLSGELDLCQPADLSEGNAMHREAVQRHLDLGFDFLEAEERAVPDVEAALAKQLAEAGRKKGPKGSVDPLAFALAIHHKELLEYEPFTELDSEPAELEQLSLLKSFNIATAGLSRGFAELLLETLNRRAADGLATPAQVIRLTRMNDPNASRMSRNQAQAALLKNVTGWNSTAGARFTGQGRVSIR